METVVTTKQEQKNSKISASLAATKAKRKGMNCSVITVKIQNNKLNHKQREHLKRIFLEAKWLYNDILASNDIWHYRLPKQVGVIVPDGVETRELSHIGSQMKQEVLTGIQSSIKTLSSLKKKGFKVGKLQYKSEYTSINLKQFGKTYSIKGNKIKIQNLGKPLYVRGLKQISDNFEIANAKLVKKADGYYIAITTYKKPEKKDLIKTDLGIDMGIKTHITTSTGKKYNVMIGETERLKRLQRKKAKQVKGSNNYYRTIHLLRKEYQKLNNRKDDMANKITAELLEYERVYFQDEMLSSWKQQNKGFARNIQHSVMGRVKTRLKASKRTVMLKRSVATTKTCKCGEKNAEMVLGVEIFACKECSYTNDRDVHAAENMVRLGKNHKNRVPTGRRDIKPVEMK